jgi:hypothetical protein
MTQVQLEQKRLQVEMNKQAAQKLLLGLRAQLSRNRVSSIQLSDSK